MNYKKKVLKNGLRIIAIKMKDAPSVTVMSLIEAGSKYETQENNGLSHFLEHMCFKGTKKRPRAIDISREFDSLGAQNNAFTSQEFTGYWGKAHPKHFDRLLDLVSDLYLHPTFPAEDLEREKGVIIEEINMYEDLPLHKVYDVWYELLYSDQPAGRTILGPRENIRAFKRDDFIRYRAEHYVAEATAIIVAGNIEPQEVFKKVAVAFKDTPVTKRGRKPKVVEHQTAPAIKIKYKDTDQTHLILGFRAFDAYDKRTPALKLLSTLLGGGMSSRLFQKMREELGICYYIKSEADQFTDHGVLAIRAGVDSSRIEEGLNGILEEVRRIRDEKIDPQELKKAKDYLIGNIYLGLESSDALTDFYGWQEILRNEIKTPKEIEREINRLTADEIKKVAKTLIQNKNLNLAILGKYENIEPFQKLLKV